MLSKPRLRIASSLNSGNIAFVRHNYIFFNGTPPRKSPSAAYFDLFSMNWVAWLLAMYSGHVPYCMFISVHNVSSKLGANVKSTLQYGTHNRKKKH